MSNLSSVYHSNKDTVPSSIYSLSKVNFNQGIEDTLNNYVVRGGNITNNLKNIEKRDQDVVLRVTDTLTTDENVTDLNMLVSHPVDRKYEGNTLNVLGSPNKA